MRYAVISDIHSNLEALEAFLKCAESLSLDKTVCLGDIVGYNANPNECVGLVREKKMLCLMGNHDSRVAGLEEPTDFNLQAAQAVLWTRKNITPENAEFLRKLPRTLPVNKKFLAVHGWINDTDRYIFGHRDALANFEMMEETKTGLCFFGHTHVPVAYVKGEEVEGMRPFGTVKLEKDKSYLVNPGSIGQPRDRDPRASFLVYDDKKSEITFYRTDYDIAATAAKIMEAGLPERLAERLKLGW
ncbi:MAG TPA: metallophosphoesterase family protein [Thermodesulfobacteriota bacterium]|nr:metallophosphoesterase family protein [Thermodesulfobacteriota bacterium]